jgi:squalene-associated FAD-dependent desaturase
MTPGSLSGRHVVVAGAGLAGLSAALECADLGARVTLLERQRRLGGLTWSFERNGISMDNGQHVYLACCGAYRRFLDRIGSSGDAEAPRPLDIPVIAAGPGGPRVGRLRRRDLPVPLHLGASLLAFPHLPLADRLRLGRAFAALARLELADPGLDRVTFGSWLAAHGQSRAAISAIWDLVTVPTVNLPSAEASLAVAAMVFRTGLLASRDAADIGWSRVPLGRLHGERAARALDAAGVTTLTGARVLGLDRHGDAPGWQVRVAGGTIEADALIVAVPHEEASAIVPPGSVTAQHRWPELGSAAVVDVHLVFDRRVTGWEFLAGHGSEVQWVFDRTAASGLADTDPGRQYLAVSLSASDHLLAERPDSLITTTVAALGRLLPRVPEATLLDAVVTKERRATFRASPGTSAIRPGPRTRLPGLVLAGAWTATGWPATMEGAVLSGTGAARTLAGGPPLVPSRIQINQEVA